MKIIADSGSTKTMWLLVSSEGLIKTIETAGYNPFYYEISQLQQIITQSILPQILHLEVDTIVFYGSGCSTAENCRLVETALRRINPQAKIIVYHDLLAAAHALLGNEQGIACILGTGSNSCLYDGKQIVANVPSLGFMLADEGSGVYIGKLLITDVLYGNAPSEITQMLHQQYRFSRASVLEAIYRKDRPAAYIAGFSKFVSQNIHHPFCKTIVSKAFDDFIRVHVSKYENYQKYPIAFVGSVANAFQDILDERLALAGLKLGAIEAAPSEGLIRYHS